ncbi:MAG: molybdate ABC transporter substrate-binding protein [Candidatus Limnocylindrales bacterium]
MSGLGRSDRLGGLAWVAVVGAIVAGCAGSQAAGGSPTGGPLGSGSAGGLAGSAASRRDLTVYAAASLTDALTALAPRFEATRPGLRLVVSTDASSALRAKIEQGAPVDVFLSADTKNAQALADEHLAGTPVAFARNLLTIVVPAADPVGVISPADLARPGLKVVAAGPDVPITRYADQAVARLATLPGYPAGYVAAVGANIVSREDNVRAVLAKVELGEADAGIVYATDARSSAKVRTIAIPAAANVPATYAAVTISTSAQPTDAQAFLDWLVGAEAQSVLASLGFLPPA